MKKITSSKGKVIQKRVANNATRRTVINELAARLLDSANPNISTSI